jgi:hypothetical protein
MSVDHSSMTPTEVRLGLFRNGYHPLPLNFKNPIRSGWQNGFDLNEGEIELWATSWPNAANTGILTRHTPVLDIDILVKEAAEAAEALVAEQTKSDSVLVRIGLPPKRAIPFRTDAPFAKINVPLIAPNGEEHKIEFLGDGQQAVVDGVHPDTHAPYSWHGGSPIEIPRSDLPSIDGPTAHKLVDDIVALLIEQHGYRSPSPGPRPMPGEACLPTPSMPSSTPSRPGVWTRIITQPGSGSRMRPVPPTVPSGGLCKNSLPISPKPSAEPSSLLGCDPAYSSSSPMTVQASAESAKACR